MEIFHQYCDYAEIFLASMAWWQWTLAYLVSVFFVSLVISVADHAACQGDPNKAQPGMVVFASFAWPIFLLCFLWFWLRERVAAFYNVDCWIARKEEKAARPEPPKPVGVKPSPPPPKAPLNHYTKGGR